MGFELSAGNSSANDIDELPAAIFIRIAYL